MKIPFISAYLSDRRLNKRISELCRQSLHKRAQKRSEAAVRANQTRQHYDSASDPVCRELAQ